MKKFIKKGGEIMSSENNPYGHLLIENVKGIPTDELRELLEGRITHAKWVGDEEGGTLEASRLKSG